MRRERNSDVVAASNHSLWGEITDRRIVSASQSFGMGAQTNKISCNIHKCSNKAVKRCYVKVVQVIQLLNKILQDFKIHIHHSFTFLESEVWKETFLIGCRLFVWDQKNV